jgi:Na+-driven multidrug efflux pump
MYFDKLKGLALLLFFNAVLTFLLCTYLTKKAGANGALLSVYISEFLVTIMVFGYWFKENNYSFQIQKE